MIEHSSSMVANTDTKASYVGEWRVQMSEFLGGLRDMIRDVEEPSKV